MKGTTRVVLVVFLMSPGLWGNGLFAGSAKESPVTTANPEIPLDELALRLNPLTRSELVVEADGWQQLLQAKAQEITTAEIGVKYQREELAKADEVKAAIEDVEEAKQAASEAPADQEAVEELKKAEQEAKKTVAEAKQAVAELSANREVADISKTATEVARKKAQERGKADAKKPVKADDADAAKKVAAHKKLDKFAREKAEQRKNLLDFLTVLRAQQTALVDRFNIVLDELEEKGGEVKEYRQYVAAVSGVKVDISDMEAVWATVSGWLTSSEGGLRWLQNISVFVITVLAFIFLSRVVGKALKKVLAGSPHASKLLEEFLVVTVKRLIIAIGVLIGLAALEVNIGPLLAVIGAAGFVIAFALQDSLGNFASGILILVFKPFDVGDVVEIAGVLGRVQSMNLLAVQIRTLDNKAVIVPNNQVWGQAITNVTGTATRRVDLVFGIGYGDDMQKAQGILEDVVSKHPKVLKDPEPTIRVHELGDSSVNFICRPWVKGQDYWDVYWDLTRTVKERFDAEGVSIPFPQRDVHLITDSGGGNGEALSPKASPAPASETRLVGGDSADVGTESASA
ncbi:MAG TPA: mechanosensitive ion channel [Gammaproteobacteria bacterium]|nr:mechanosensitive ion channel [Gammaproteobacteria bacterium]